MKVRESTMPSESDWRSFYDADCVVARLDCITTGDESVAEFGSGYGTFTLPVARRTTGTVHAFEIESELVSSLRYKAREQGLANIDARRRDLVEQGTALADASMDHAMVYNLLHIEHPVPLLREAYRILKPGGTLSIIHWKHDPATPRGPSLAIRPRPAQCRQWAERAGFVFLRHQDLAACCRHHYGMVVVRPR